MVSQRSKLPMPTQVPMTNNAQVAPFLLRLCSSFCRLAHIDRATPPHLILGYVEMFDAEVHLSFADYTAVDVPDSASRQAQLSLRGGGFGLRSLALHSSAAYIASLCVSDDVISTPHLKMPLLTTTPVFCFQIPCQLAAWMAVLPHKRNCLMQ